MTAPTDTTPNAVVKRTALTPQQQAIIDERRARGLMVNQIRGTVWAKEFDAATISAVANWASANDVEPVTEIDVLGGRLYLNSRYYERKLAELVGAQQIDYARPVWVHIDKRLEALADAGDSEAKAISRKRMLMRIEFSLPDEADAACVFEIKHRHMTEPVRGAKAHIMGRKKTIKKRDGGSFTVDADPVGDQAPMETIETRALRRAMLKLKEAFPQLRLATSREDDTIDVNAVVHAQYEELKADREVRQITPGTSTLETAETLEPESEPAMVSRRAVPEGLEEEPDGLSDEEIALLDEQREQQAGLGIDDRKPNRTAQARGR